MHTCYYCGKDSYQPNYPLYQPLTIVSSTCRFPHSSLLMMGYTPPKTRRKPTDAITAYDVEHFKTYDGIQHVDEQQEKQDYIHQGESLALTCLTDIDLAGQPDTRQSTSAYTLYLNGAMFHWRAYRKTNYQIDSIWRIHCPKSRQPSV
jgi:hypothetical protein